MVIVRILKEKGSLTFFPLGGNLKKNLNIMLSKSGVLRTLPLAKNNFPGPIAISHVSLSGDPKRTLSIFNVVEPVYIGTDHYTSGLVIEFLFCAWENFILDFSFLAKILKALDVRREPNFSSMDNGFPKIGIHLEKFLTYDFGGSGKRKYIMYLKIFSETENRPEQIVFQESCETIEQDDNNVKEVLTNFVVSSLQNHFGVK